jgi:LEA14-like dessication related protein
MNGLMPPRVIFLGIGLIWLTGCTALKGQFKDPEVKFERADIENMSLAAATVGFRMRVSNPNALGFTMNGLNYVLKLDGKNVLQGKSTDQVKIPAKGDGIVKLPLTFRYLNVFGSLADLAKKRSVSYNLSGKMNLGFFSLPYSKSGSLALPQLPKVKVKILQVKNLSLDGAQLGLQLEVQNANNFPIMIDGMEYGVNLAQRSLIRGSSQQDISVAPKGSSNLNLNLDLGFAQFGQTLGQLLRGSDIPLTLDGAFAVPNAGGGMDSLPFQWDGTLPVRR